jgi:hypothetical protein
MIERKAILRFRYLLLLMATACFVLAALIFFSTVAHTNSYRQPGVRAPRVSNSQAGGI